MTFTEKVSKIQAELKAPKNQFNKFGGYKYRSCEDILEAVKPLLGGLVLTISDEIIMMGDRFYVKATATLGDGETSVSNSALAREALTKKGMDESQITGTASSYARKYALNGLFLIDDTKDADTMDNSDTPKQKPQRLDPKVVENFNNIDSLAGLKALWDSLSADQHKLYAKVKDNVKIKLVEAET